MNRIAALSLLLPVALLACGGSSSVAEPTSEADAATAGANGYYAFAAPSKSAKSGDAYVSAVNGQKMTCADGKVAAECLVFLDFGALVDPNGNHLDAGESAAARAAFLAGDVILKGSFGKQTIAGKTRTALQAKSAWKLAGETGPGGQVFLATQKGILFHDAKLNVHTTYDARAIDLSDFAITGDQQAAAFATASKGGLLVRGTHVKDGTATDLAADAFWMPIAHAAGVQDLTVAQDTEVTKALNDICGDTWCDGDYEWTLHDVRCSFAARTCSLFAEAADTGLPDGETPRTFTKSCDVNGFGSYADMIVVTNGYVSLVPAFYSAVTTCVQTMQSTIPPRP